MEMNYRSGVVLLNHTVSGPGPVWISGLRCTGQETSIMDCEMSDMHVAPQSSCGGHKSDLVIKCFSKGTYIITYDSHTLK